MANWKIEILKFFKFNGNKKISHSQGNLFSNTLKKQSKKIETEPTKWLKSKDSWKSEWIRQFSYKNSVCNIEKRALKRVKKWIIFK